MKFSKKELLKTVAMFLQEKDAELKSLRDFVRSLNSLAFEEWHGRYSQVGSCRFCILDGDGDVVASGSDAYEAWRNLTADKPPKDKPTDGGIFGKKGLFD